MIHRCGIASIVLFTASLFSCLAVAQSPPQLLHERSLGYFPSVQPTPFALRLSPDGRFLLYPQESPNPDNAELVLKDLDQGTMRTVPGLSLPRGEEKLYTRFSFFSPQGTQLLVIAPPSDAQPASTVSIYDIAFGQLQDGTLQSQGAARRFWARFDFTGKNLIVNEGSNLAAAALPDLKLRPLKATGMLQSLCPTDDLIAVLDVSNGEEPRSRLYLYDVAKDGRVAELPVHPRSRGLDEFESQWTADGRYLFYCDREENPVTASPTFGTRIWDRKAGKSLAFLQNMLPIGRGPTPTTVILAMAHAQGSWAYLYDAATAHGWQLGEAEIQLIHGWGDKLIYMKSSDNRLFIADIEVPTAVTTTQP